jgi:nucleotide-binding universal stress UspA family protein
VGAESTVKIQKILLPVDYPNPFLNVIHEAALMARQFGAEIVMLHVVTPKSHLAGAPLDARGIAGWDLLAETLRGAEKRGDSALREELSGISIRRVLGNGDPASGIVQLAEQEQADLIMMASQGEVFYEFLLSSVTAKVLHGTPRPIWTGAHVEKTRVGAFAIKNVLCAIDLGMQTRQSILWAKGIATALGARLTLAHVTAGFEMWGPGGSYVNVEIRDSLIRDANRRIAELKTNLGVDAEVFIGSGDVPKGLRQAAKETNADLLVTGCQPYGGHLRTHGYSILCAVPIPVLNV